MKPVIFFTVAAILSLFVSFVAAQTNATDQGALIAFWDGLTGQGSLGWNTSQSLCGHNGVTCDATGKVVELNVRSFGLSGSISTRLGQLTSLTSL